MVCSYYMLSRCRGQGRIKGMAYKGDGAHKGGAHKGDGAHKRDEAHKGDGAHKGDEAHKGDGAHKRGWGTYTGWGKHGHGTGRLTFKEGISILLERILYCRQPFGRGRKYACGKIRDFKGDNIECLGFL